MPKHPNRLSLSFYDIYFLICWHLVALIYMFLSFYEVYRVGCMICCRQTRLHRTFYNCYQAFLLGCLLGSIVPLNAKINLKVYKVSMHLYCSVSTDIWSCVRLVGILYTLSFVTCCSMVQKIPWRWIWTQDLRLHCPLLYNLYYLITLSI